MKKLFTLLGVVLMASTAFGQTNWKNIIVNGDFEAEVPAYENYAGMAADAWNSFWVHEWPKGEAGETQYQGTATIVEGVGRNGSKCAKVVARSEEAADAAGNKTKNDNGELVSWDCQFFIYATEPMPVGKEVRLTMYVKGDKAGSIETQAHYGPGDYNHYQLFGNVSVTTEWQKVVLEGTVSSDQGKEGDGKYFQSVAFNLSTDKAGNVFYFDDVKLQMRDPKTDDGSDAGAWINFMRKGIYSMDNIVGKDDKGNTFHCTNYTFQDLNQPEGQQQQPAPVVEVPGEPGVYAVRIPVRGYTIKEVEDLDEEGNQQFDDDGNVKMKPGEKYRFKFKAKADKPTSLATQCHYGPGQYQSYNTFGDESAFPIGTDWTEFKLGDFEGNENKTIPSVVAKPQGDVGCQTITFDCISLEGDDNIFYLIVDEFSFTEKYVLDADRTLGTPEDIALPVSAGDDEKAVHIDAAPMLNTFEVEDFSFLNNGKDGIKLLALTQPEDPEEEPTETFSGLLPWTDGGFINGQGYFMEDENGINIRLDDESIDGSKINVMVWNNPDSGLKFDNGESITTKLAISQSGWYYIYNVTLSADGATGIKDIQLEQKTNAIYDLMGRKVSKMDKGIYIVNGKKYIVK